MADPIKLVQSDTLPQIKLILTDQVTGNPIDLTGATVSLHAKPAAGVGTSFSREAMFVLPTDRVNGISYIQWMEGDLNRSPGNYNAEIEIVYPTGGRETIYDTLLLQIREDIGDISPLPGTPTGTGTPNAPMVVLSPTSLSPAPIGVLYSVNITATGAGQPYTYSITSGTLPVGLTLSSSGLLSGTPTLAGTYNFTITAANTVEYVGSRSYSIVVS